MRYPPASSSASEAAQFSPTQNQYQQYPRRPQLGHHATTYDRPSSGDDIRVRGLADRPSRDPIAASITSRSRHSRALRNVDSRARDTIRDRRVDPDDRPAPIIRHRDAYPPQPNLRRRSRSPSRHPQRPSRCAPGPRQRSRDRLLPVPFPRHRVPDPRDRFRDHETPRSPEFDTAVPHLTSGADIEKAYSLKTRSPSPLVYDDRQQTRSHSRSRSPAAPKLRARQPRLVTTSRRFDREACDPRLSPWPIVLNNSPPQEYTSARHGYRRQKGLGRSVSPSPPDTRHSQYSLSQGFNDNPNLAPLGLRPSSRLEASDLSFRTSRQPSPRRRTLLPPQAGRHNAIQGSPSRSRRTPNFSGEREDYPPPPPFEFLQREPRELFPLHSGSSRELPRPEASPLDALATGVNTIEVNMSARGNFRGNYGGQYPMRGHYNQGQNDQRNFAHSTPGSSFQGSPPSQSPYPSSRGSWGGQQQSSPQNQFSSQYPQNGYAPAGPAAHLQGSPANAPPIGTPTGPSAQFASGRGYRGSSGGYRGNGSGTGGRGGGRGGFKSGHWGSNSGSRAASSQPDDVSSGRATPRTASNAGDSASSHGDDRTHDADNPFRPPKELQVEDMSNDEKNDTQPMPPPTSRPPPTGPAAEKKISFALKLAPKAPVATPKLEISSKFSAPAKKEASKEPTRHEPRDARDRRDSRDAKNSRDSRDSAQSRHHADMRDLPRNVPTEPRAAKARQQRQEHRHEPRNDARHDPRPEPREEPHKERQPREPRVRIVKKKMKRLKQKPTLPDDLIGSDSVYFRKPGNESVIGAGTYGKVFKALHVYTKNLVALKRIRMEGERDGFPVTAVREIKLLQSLRHINIVALLEVMVEKNECYMVFEYMSHDLTGLLNHPTFTLDAAHRKHLSKQLFEGLDYLHKRGVLHRDIKAANILVSSDGILKLADFGLARFYAKRHQLDYTNRVITIWYRSPELLLGETQYGPAVDIWSAACVMVEIFTRRAIFPGDGGEISQLDKIYSVLGTPHKSDWPGLIDMPWFELLRPGVRKPNLFEAQYKERLPPAAFELMVEMLRYDPAKRPTAAEVLEHAYFTKEAPAPRQVVELQEIEGDWHEFESKALRRENERKDREARKAAEKGAIAAASSSSSSAGKDPKKRPPEQNESHRESKRQHVEAESSQRP